MNSFHVTAPAILSRPLPGSILPGIGSLLSQGSDPTLPRQFRVALLFALEGRRGFFSDYAPDSLEFCLPPIDTTPGQRLPPKCGLCRLPGHTRPRCPNPPSNAQCRTCRLAGHDAAICTNGPPPPNPSSNYYKAWGKLVNGSSTCPLCNINEPLGPAHLLVRCTNPAIVTRRNAIIAELPHFAGNLVSRLSHTQAWSPRSAGTSPPRPSIPANWPPAALAASRAVSSTTSWSSGHGAWLLFHALTATPWSVSSLADSPPSSWDGIARILACEFDNSRVPSHRWRGLTNWWLRWAGSRTHELFLLWQSEANALDARALQRPL